jgi:hypothetical protein
VTAWTPEDLALLTASESLVLTAGEKGYPSVEIGMVLVRGELYVRAYRGVRSRWYQAAQEHGHGRIRVGAVTRDVLLDGRVLSSADDIDAAYLAKYGQAASGIVASPTAHAATIRMDPVPQADGHGAERPPPRHRPFPQGAG